MDIRGYDPKKVYQLLDSYICDDRTQTYISHGYKIKPGTKAEFKPLSGIGLVDRQLSNMVAIGEITYVNYEHKWFTVEYGDGRTKTSFNFGDIGHTVTLLSGGLIFMHENLKQFIKDIGTLCEVWAIIYKSFINQGMTEKEALTHTQAFMTATMNSQNGKHDGT